MEDKWIQADKLAEKWELTPLQLVDDLRYWVVERKMLTPHNDKLTPVKEIAIGNLGAIYFLSEEIKAIERELFRESLRVGLQSEDPQKRERYIQLLRSSGWNDANMDALLTEAEPQSDTAPESPEVKDADTILRRAQAMAVANIVKRDFPDLTIKEAALEINARLAATGAFDKDGNPLMQGYSVKHLMRLIKPLGFKPGKPGQKPKK